MSFLDALPVTILYGTLNALIVVALALNVSLNRMSGRVFLSDQPPPELHRRIRAHGNSVEYFAVTTLLLAFLELQRAPSFWLHICGGLVLLARIVHSFAMLSKSGLSVRRVSATTTYAISLVMGFWSLYLRLR
ncbi:MAG TPA: MAPEG family protein [Myxococcales bacterium]|jgi:hypothetical protein